MCFFSQNIDVYQGLFFGWGGGGWHESQWELWKETWLVQTVHRGDYLNTTHGCIRINLISHENQSIIYSNTCNKHNVYWLMSLEFLLCNIWGNESPKNKLNEIFIGSCYKSLLVHCPFSGGRKKFEDDLDQLDRSGGYGSELSQTWDVWEAALERRYLESEEKHKTQKSTNMASWKSGIFMPF